MTRKATYDFTAPVVVDLTEARFEKVHAGEATPEEEKRYFHEVVKPASDARRSAVSEAGRRYFEDVTKPIAFGEAGTSTTATDLSEDAAFEAFAAQSGMNDMLGREPGTREAADLAAPPQDERVDAAADVSDQAMWSAFVELTGFEDAAPAGGVADLSEDGHDDAGDGSEISDDEAWKQYQAAIGGNA